MRSVEPSRADGKGCCSGTALGEGLRRGRAGVETGPRALGGTGLEGDGRTLGETARGAMGMSTGTSRAEPGCGGLWRVPTVGVPRRRPQKRRARSRCRRCVAPRAAGARIKVGPLSVGGELWVSRSPAAPLLLPKTSTAPSVPSDQPLVRPLAAFPLATCGHAGQPRRALQCCARSAELLRAISRAVTAQLAGECGLGRLGQALRRGCEKVRWADLHGRAVVWASPRCVARVAPRTRDGGAEQQCWRRGLAQQRADGGGGGEQGRDSRCRLGTKSGRREGGEEREAAKAARGKIHSAAPAGPGALTKPAALPFARRAARSRPARSAGRCCLCAPRWTCDESPSALTADDTAPWSAASRC